MVGFVNRAASCYNQWFSPTAAAAHQLFLQGWNTNPGIFKSLPSFPFPILHCNSFFHHSPLFLIHPLSISSIISSVEAVAVEVSSILLLVLCVKWIPSSPQATAVRVSLYVHSSTKSSGLCSVCSPDPWVYTPVLNMRQCSPCSLCSMLVWNMRLQSAAVCLSMYTWVQNMD